MFGSNRIPRSKNSALRIVVWNVRMGLSRKWTILSDLKPDIAILPEVSSALPTEADHGVWIGSNPTKGLGVVSFGPYTVSRAPSYDESLRWIAPVRVNGPVPFFLLAVWTTYVKGGQAYRQADQAVRIYRREIGRGPTVVAGDFNTYWPGAFASAKSSIETGLDLISAYHYYYDVRPGREWESTLYYRGNPKSLIYHYDYCLVPQAWAEQLHSVRLGKVADWIKTGLSDHVPLVVDIRKGNR